MDESRPVVVHVGGPSSDEPTTRSGRLCRAGLFLGVGLAAGMIACEAIDRYGNAFRLSPEAQRLERQRFLTSEEGAILSKAILFNSYQNTALSVAILGGVAGGVLGFTAGLWRRRLIASAGGLIGGTALGAAFGALGGLIELYAANRLWWASDSRILTTMIWHSSAYLVAGIGIGLGVGLASRQMKRSLGVVLAAALVAGLIYPGIAAAAFPLPNTEAVVPGGSGPRLLWTATPLALMGLALGRTRAVVPAARA